MPYYFQLSVRSHRPCDTRYRPLRAAVHHSIFRCHQQFDRYPKGRLLVLSRPRSSIQSFELFFCYIADITEDMRK